MATPSLNLIYKIEGEFEDGIDVFALAPVLLNLGNLIQEANTTLYPGGDEISVNVKPFKEGSFVLDIGLIPPSVIEQIARAIFTTDLSQLKTLLECIGLVATGATTGAGTLYGLLKFLRGKPKAVKKLPNGEVRYTAQNGTQVNVTYNVHALYQNGVLPEAAAKSLIDAVELPGATGVKTFLKDSPEKTTTKFTKEDAEDIATVIRPPPALPMIEVKDIKNTSKVYLHPKTVDLEGGPFTWSFRKLGNDDVVKARIVARTFLDAIKAGEVRLSAQDVLFVEMVERQTYKDKTWQTTNEIVEVIAYRSADRQESLAFPESGDTA